MPQLPVTGPFTPKDQRKADICNKFIGRGSARSSTHQYALAYGAMANCGQYTIDDVVFVSAEGARTGRLSPDFEEIQKAIDAQASIVTDKPSDRDRNYNIGERQVAEYLRAHGYFEVIQGGWVPRSC